MNATAIHSRQTNLLTLARNIRHYEEALSNARGEGFNLFNILRVGHYEVRTHSPLLAELLNPHGRHGQGPAFLKHFLTRIKLTSFDSESARVSKEYHIGTQTEEEGGRLDILIRDKAGREILIENKIYAGLQPNQLGRYRKFSSRGTLIFLTLNGDPPEGLSNDQLTELNCVRISYKNDIVAWLQDCRKEAANAPCVRETITQYIHLLQELTEQNTSTRMNQELIKAVLQDQETFLAYSALCKAESDVRGTIINSLIHKLQAVAQRFCLTLETYNLPERYGGITFSNHFYDKQGFGIGVEFGKKNFQDCCFGFYRTDRNQKSPVEDQLQKAFKLEFGRFDSSAIWPAWIYWEEHRDWNDETFAAIQFGNFADEFKNQLERLVKVANSVCDAPNE